MQQLIADFPAHLSEAARLRITHSDTPKPQALQNVLIVGMGGSGIGGALAISLLEPLAPCPIQCLSTYDLPAYVGARTLVLASSFSGNTEETLQATHTALHARQAPVLAVTSGGQLGDWAQQHQFPHVMLPVKAASPRAHLGFSLAALLKLLHWAGISPKDFTDDLQRIADFIAQQQNQIAEEAEQVAHLIHGFLPIIYTDQTLLPVATRLRQQINENAKQLAHIAPIPEMNHNELVAWNDPTDLLRKTRVIFMASDFEHPRVGLRRQILHKLLPSTTTAYHFKTQGKDLLTQLFYAIHWGDWLSWYLAQQNGVDPFPVSIIEQLKAALKQEVPV
ncbi:MAG: bifunctional phosphoglucose/phosphomannose isomerase [Bernardetiaceae bacterium]